VWSVESQVTFQSNMLPPSSGSENKLCLWPTSCWFLSGLFFDQKMKVTFTPKHQLTFNGLFGIISQKVIIITTVRTSNPFHIHFIQSSMQLFTYN
jgi:hypothetical protein